MAESKKWFVVHTYSGFENKAKKSLEEKIRMEGLQDSFGEILIPVEQVVEMVMPGDNIAIEVELITPIAMEKELRFAIREGGRTVGAGVVAEVLE